MNDGYHDDTDVDPALLESFNRGTQRAIRANWDREAREKHLDSLYFWTANTPKKRVR